jgi:hypothetical protein
MDRGERSLPAMQSASQGVKACGGGLSPTEARCFILRAMARFCRRERDHLDREDEVHHQASRGGEIIIPSGTGRAAAYSESRAPELR